MKMRWFGGKGRLMQGLRIVDLAPISMETSQAVLLLIEVTYESGLPEMYQLAVTFGDDASMTRLLENCPQAAICRLTLEGVEGLLYDAIYGHELQKVLFERLASGNSISQKQSEILFNSTRALKKYVKEHKKIRSRILAAEQSNTSLVFDNKFFMKIYRKVDRAINPDVEITEFLSEKAKFPHVPSFMGSIEWIQKGQSMVLAMAQDMVESSGDAWVLMLSRLHNFYEKVLSGDRKHLLELELRGNLTSPASYDEIPEELKELIEAQLAEQARLLGVRTGEMHLALASTTDQPDFVPEDFSLHYQRSLYSSFQSLVRATLQNQVRNLKKLNEKARKEAEDILAMKEDILTVFRRIYRRKFDVVKIRIHGDYHLGQVLYTGKDFVILDFEGEPARSYSERRLKRSPLRDVSGMIRSFHYAAYGGLLLNDQVRKEDLQKLLPFAEVWYHYMSGFFTRAYLETVAGSPFLPDDPEDLAVMLQTYLLEKAIYELNYELNNRPDWVMIPMRGIKAIMEAAKSEKALKA